MTVVTQILHGVLPNCKVHYIASYVEVHALLTAFTPCAVFVSRIGQFYSAPFGVEAFIKLEANSLLPSIVEVLLSEGPKLDIALIREIDKLKLEVIPVVEGKDICVDLFIEG